MITTIKGEGSKIEKNSGGGQGGPGPILVELEDFFRLACFYFSSHKQKQKEGAPLLHRRFKVVRITLLISANQRTPMLWIRMLSKVLKSPIICKIAQNKTNNEATINQNPQLTFFFFFDLQFCMTMPLRGW